MKPSIAPQDHSTSRAFVPPGRAQVLADLRWLLLSPPLLSPETFPGLIHRFSTTELAAVENWLNELETRADPEYLQPAVSTPMRLGRYAERLMLYFLGPVSPDRKAPARRKHGFNLLAHSLARRGTGIGASTLGEIDFLLETPDRQSWHWELAVKVYLCEEKARRSKPEVATPRDLHGPNRAETFEAKLDKLFEKQLQQPIPDLPIDASSPSGFARKWHRAAFAKGRIFYRIGESAPDIFTSHGQPLLNPGHLRGFWCPAREFKDLLRTQPGCTAWPLERLEWLSPKSTATLDTGREPMNERAISTLVSPVMVAMMRDNLELTRGFVLPDPQVPVPGAPT